MTTAYTSLLGLALPVSGELSGTWGDTVNTEITALLDSAIAGTTTLSSDADVTLTTTTGAANTARPAILLWTAGGTVTRNITAPAQSKVYVVINASSSTQSIVLRGAGPTTGVTIVQGEKVVCAWNGTDFVKVAASAGGTTIPAGTAMLFAQTAAPTGFTKSTTHDNKALRVVSGAASSGGSVAFTTAFASQAVAGTVGTSGATTLTTAQIPSHNHSASNNGGDVGILGSNATNFPTASAATTGSTGGGGSHTHAGGAFTGTAINLAVSYVDVIIATKD